MRQIVLIGTCHMVQYPGNNTSDEFRAFVEGLCGKYGIRIIGEELSEDALEEKHKPHSVCQEIAITLNISHHYCDPGHDQRKALGILQENDIKARGWLEGWASERVELEIRASHSIRERYWLDRLNELNVWPALLICGANHVRYFHDLAKQHGFDVIVAAMDWSPPSASATSIS